MIKIQDLKPGSSIYLMGICGTAMASLAGLLKDKGYKVSGSDLNPYPPMSTQLASLNIEVKKGYHKENLSPRPDFVIIGNVISAQNEEAQAVMQMGIPYASLPQSMGEFIIAEKQSVVIAGTHGKTTTTSMMAWVFECLGAKPGFLIGGIPKNFSNSFRNSDGDYFVIEGDEYDTAFFDKVPKFVHYRPRHAVLTSLEFDHADIYKDLDAVKASFLRLMKLIPKEGTLVYCADEPNVVEVQKQCSVSRKVGYGLQNGDYQARGMKVSESETRFEVVHKGQSLGEFSMVLGGNYNVLNALSVVALTHQLGMDLGLVRKGLKSFEGVKRRQEIRGEPDGVLIIEDFAHHPTAVRETISGLQKKYAGRKFFSVFEPRSATSRRKVFQEAYVEAFLETQEILIAEPYDQSKITEGDRFSAAELVQDLQSKKKSAAVFPSADAIVKDLTARAKRGDVVLIMSNGGFDGIYEKLIASLQGRSRS